LTVIAGKMSSLGERTAQEVQRVLARRAKELETGYTRELEELRAFEARVKKDIQALVTRATEGFRDLPKAVNSENLPAARAQIIDSLLELERALSEQFWHLGDLDRKMKAAESSLGGAKALGKMSIEELAALLIGEKGKAMLSVEEHLLRFYELRETLKGEYAQIWARKSKELAAALREEIGKNQAAVKEARRTIEKDGKGTSDRLYLEEMVRAWEAELTVLSEMESSKGLAKAYAVEQVVTGYVQFMQNIIEPFVIAKALEAMVRASLPPAQDLPPHEKRQALDEEQYLTLACEAEGGLFTFGGASDRVCQAPSAEALRHRKELSGLCQRRCGRVVTVLAYSIRGTDYLTTRLGDAAKARQIRNRFASAMVGAGRRAGAFLLKETEEGGIFWFGESSRELYERGYKESGGGEGTRLRHLLAIGKDIEIAADSGSGRNAIACATEMLLHSERFIKEHFALFKEWFKETPEWKGLPEGVPYNALPLELKRLFRVGIGLASGLPGKDLAFGSNAFGDPDLLGVALSDAVLLSRLQGLDAEQGLRSTVLADECTILNLALNLEHFTLEEHGRAFLCEALGAKMRRIGYCLFGPTGGGARVLLTEKEETLELDPLGSLRAKGGERTKVLYQVQPIESLTKK
jgi:class 3 adenylate cyclase